MNNTLIDNWNKTVSPEDTVYLLGDFLFKRGTPQMTPTTLNGNITLIRGNHDRGISDTQFKTMYGIKEVYAQPLVIYEQGYEIVLMHAPRQLHTNRINLCGHVHQAWESRNGFYNVGVDIHNFTPISIDYILDKIKKGGIITV